MSIKVYHNYLRYSIISQVWHSLFCKQVMQTALPCLGLAVDRPRLALGLAISLCYGQLNGSMLASSYEQTNYQLVMN